MAGESLKSVVRHIRRLIGGPAGDLTDRQLLDRFISAQAEDAFATLVDRHGPLVLSVCRRVLADSHDADDAFQATFLVLARKAGSIRQRESLAAWLYGVATRVSLRMRGQLARRRTHEKQAADMRDLTPTSAAAWDDLRPALDEELQRLPEKFRVPLVLHYFQGKNTAQVAAELGCPPGSLTWRLMRGRDLLRDRLARRGLALPAALFATLLTENAGVAAVVPGTLATTTVQAALAFMAGQAVASLPAVTHAQGVIQAMYWTKLRNVAATLAAVCVISGGLAMAAVLAPLDNAPKDRPGDAKPAADKGKVDPEGTPLELKIVANKDTYTLDAELKKKLENINVNGRPALLAGGPQGSAVDLTLEIKNTSDKEVEVWKAGDPVKISFQLEGKGAVTRNVNRPRAAIYMFPQSVKLAPGKSFSIPVRALDNNVQASYFTEPGEYTLTATLVTGMLPAPKGAKISEAESGEVDVNQPVPPIRRVPPGVKPLPQPLPPVQDKNGAAPGAAPAPAPRVNPVEKPGAEEEAAEQVVPGAQGGGAVPAKPVQVVPAKPVQIAPANPGQAVPAPAQIAPGQVAPAAPALAKKGFGIVTLTSPAIKLKVEAAK